MRTPRDKAGSLACTALRSSSLRSTSRQAGFAAASYGDVWRTRVSLAAALVACLALWSQDGAGADIEESRDIYEKRFDSLAESEGKYDPDRWFDLGRFASRQALKAQAREAYKKAIALDPDHEGARKALRYTRHEGRWVSEPVMRLKGYVRVDGRWVSKEETERMRREREADREKARPEADVSTKERIPESRTFTKKRTSGRCSIAVDGTRLVKNDGSGTRFFVTGMNYGHVWGHDPYDLERYQPGDIERIIKTISGYGGSAVGWRTFLKGTQLRYGADGLCVGMPKGSVGYIRHTLDTAQENGIVALITLSTAHFLRYGSGGRNQRNMTRVRNNKRLLTTAEGTRAYVENVVKPLVSGIGPHPGLLSYLVVNEAGGMVRESDVKYGHWSDEVISLQQMQRFVNRVAGAIHDAEPSALVAVAAVTFPNVKYWNDRTLIAAGGHRKGVVDYYQVQFYPRHRGDSLSPFHHPFGHWKLDKPLVIGEFPCGGCVRAPNRPDEKYKPSSELNIVQSYNYLFDNGYAGGLAWFYPGFRGYSHEDTARGLRSIYAKHRQNVTLPRRRAGPRAEGEPGG